MQVATVFVNRSALRHNLQRLREFAPSSQIIAIVKANAYGHGMVETARSLNKAEAFGVARLSEALTLRAAGITQPIMLLEGFFHPQDLTLIADQRLMTAVHTLEQLEALEQAQLDKPINVWLKVDTGMHRLGVLPEHVEAFYQRLTQCKNVMQPVNMISHFVRADELDDEATEQQIALFLHAVGTKTGARSIAASAGSLFWPTSHLDWVRPGIILYGVSPLEGHPWGEELGFRPAMRLCSQLIAVRSHQAGQPVGYGATWHAPRNTRIGVIALGYGDGYPRSAPSGTPVMVNGREVPLVGRVSMDMICVDLGPDAQDKPGDEVEMWGENLPVERIAEYTKVSAYELITRLTARTAIEYLD